MVGSEHGEFFLAGGTFALYSLLCRHAKLSLILNQQTADREVSTYKLVELPDTIRGEKVRKLLEKHRCLRTGLLIIVLLGTSMVIGDGILTPSISGMVCAPFGTTITKPMFLEFHAKLAYSGSEP